MHKWRSFCVKNTVSLRIWDHCLVLFFRISPVHTLTLSSIATLTHNKIMKTKQIQIVWLWLWLYEYYFIQYAFILFLEYLTSGSVLNIWICTKLSSDDTLQNYFLKLKCSCLEKLDWITMVGNKHCTLKHDTD